jgi:hypothetical protein
MLIKATQRCWAEEMLRSGRMRFGAIWSYQAWESHLLGDPDDGRGILTLGDRDYTTESANPVFAWCAALPSIAQEHLRELASANKYDCLVRIHSPPTLINRIRESAVGQRLWPHCANATYDKRSKVSDLSSLNSRRLDFHIFQKDNRFSPDCEYRIALIDISQQGRAEESLFLSIGDCSDILSLEPI